MQYHWNTVFSQNPEAEIKIKNIFGKTCEESKEFFEAYKDQLDPKFYELLIKATTKTTTGKPGKNAEKYEDAKITGPLTDKSEENHTIEVQFNLLNNKNESSFAHHRIYKMKTIIETIVRLQ
jgi:ABC-type transporter MlaC component